MLANTSTKVVLKIFLISSSNINMKYIELKQLISRYYNTSKTLSNISQVKLINKKNFAKVVLDNNIKTFLIYISVVEVMKKLLIYLFQIL